MKKAIRNIFLLLLSLSYPFLSCFALPSDSVTPNNLKFVANKNQWDSKIGYRVDINGGSVFLEKNTFTYVLHDLSEFEEKHHEMNEKSSAVSSDRKNGMLVKCHAYKMHFVNANADPEIIPNEKLTTYYNFYIGSDSSKWASNVLLYKSVLYKDLYSNIDLKVFGSGENLKYEFVVNPSAEPSSIVISYEGTDGLSISDKNLIIKTSVGNVIEYQPYVYQLVNGIEKEVKCKYVLTATNTVGFDFPDGYDERFPLVIDPVVVASTYSGSTATTYGHCATYDNLGNIYTGGRCFGQGYPVTTGAFQTSFMGDVDIAIGKLNSTGSAFLYATYIGGSSDEYAHSMIVNDNGELYVYGSCGSTNYPVTAGCYDNSYNGGSYDIILSRFNSTGTALLGSTYVGGQMDDGSNDIYYNYGDEFRGEIILDGSENPLIASFSGSIDFPTTLGAYDRTYNSGQDGVVFKMNPNLTTLTWSTFLGGTGDDAAFGIQVNSVGMVYVTGGTTGSFPTTPVVLHPNYMGGSYDGFISILQNNGSSLMASSYFGTSSFDELFFIDVDDQDNIYVYGLSEGNYPITPGVYSSPGSSGRLIVKLDPTLNSVIYSTTFGAGAEAQNFSPTAFLVDVCQNVYVAGWGSVSGFPVTANAVQSSTDGSDFYLLVLKKDAISLLYATYYGDPNAWEHVDGGTSRFDKRGIIYEAVCAGGSSFPTLPGSVSTVNNAGYDIAVFKIDFQLGQVLAAAMATPSDSGCVPFTVNFANTSNGVSYIWDFGDGTPQSTVVAPSHTYNTAGTFDTKLIAIDSSKCNIADTLILRIYVTPGPEVDLGDDTTICPGDNLILDVGTPGLIYLWSTGETTQTITVADSGYYWVQVQSYDCYSWDTIHVFIPSANPLTTDTSLCSTTPLVLDAQNPGSTYVWSTGETTQTINVDSSGIYWVNILIENCPVRDSIDVTFYSQPVPDLGNDTTFCQYVDITLNAGNPGCNYFWSTGATTQTIHVDTIGTYWVDVSNSYCSASDSIVINAVYPPELGVDTTLCDEGLYTLNAGSNGATYLWSTGENTQSIVVNQPGTYWVQVFNAYCSTSDTIVIKQGGSFSVYFPNTFTPDNDGLNDVFSGMGEDIKFYELRIFTRWGQMIFETTDPTMGWNGKFEGELVPQDVYVWIADYKTSCTGHDIQHKMSHVFVFR